MKHSRNIFNGQTNSTIQRRFVRLWQADHLTICDDAVEILNAQPVDDGLLLISGFLDEGNRLAQFCRPILHFDLVETRASNHIPSRHNMHHQLSNWLK